ncbi:MAG TPA: hypothetical protein VN456_17465 [Desulfosporosinus sp.]|nr:hypothetical protein [Desulfosporosinus sp.]
MAQCVRFLHCAGFRFDSHSWEGLEEWAAQRNQDLWQTFEGVLSLCRSEKVDFLFLAGDLFEQEYVRKETVERVAKSLAKLNGTRIFIAPGERDPLVSTSAYRLSVWPSNVHIFLGSLSSVKIPSLNATVYGVGWIAYRQEASMLEGFQAKRDGTLQFMLLHAEVESVKNTEGYIPIRLEQIESSGLNYIALGHQEVWSGVQKTGDTYWADCGSPEARSFRESGPRGVLLGEIEKESARFEFREFGQRRYFEKTLSIQSDLECLVAKLLAETSSQERQKDLFRIMLSGPFQEVKAMAQILQKLLKETFRFVEVVPIEGRQAQFTPDVVATSVVMAKNRNGYPTLAQVFADKIQERLLVAEGTDNYQHWVLVQKIGLAALGQGRKDDED